METAYTKGMPNVPSTLSAYLACRFGGRHPYDKFQSPKIGGGGEIRTLFILPYEDNVLPIILPHHIETHCCGRRIPSDVVSRNQTFSIYTVLSAMYFNMAYPTAPWIEQESP